MMKKNVKRRGRPPLPPDEKRDVPVQFLVSRRERQEMQEAAESEGIGLSRWLRRAVRDLLKRR